MIDTLKYARRLQAAGVPQAQAVGMAEALQEAQENVVTMTRLELALEVALAPLKSELSLVRSELGLLKSMTTTTLVVGIAVALRLFLA
jgi:hypothetical protein